MSPKMYILMELSMRGPGGGKVVLVLWEEHNRQCRER